jgi:hypothetical protein
MPDELFISINKEQPYTQSPSAIIGDFPTELWVDAAGKVHQQASKTQQNAIPSIVVIYHADATKAATWQAKFIQLSRLRDGWNGYTAPAPSKKAIDTAHSFVDTLIKEKYEPKRLTPSAVGGVAVTQRNGNKKVYVEFFNDGTVFALFSDGSSEPISKEVIPGYQSFKALVKEMREYLDD